MGLSSLNTNSINTNSLSVFPNPSSGEVRIQFPYPNTTVQLRLWSTDGRLLLHKKQQSGIHLLRVDLSPFENGVFLYEIKNGNEKWGGKLVKM